MKTPLHSEAARAVDGAVVTGIGQLVGCVVGLAMAMLVPRWLGVSDFGHWVIYRSMISLVAGLSSLGAPEIVARCYVGRAAVGEHTAAARVFKAVLVVRMTVACIAAGLGFAVLRQSSMALSSLSDSLCLAGSIVSQGAQICFVLLLYGDRRMRAVSVVQVMQAAVVPLAVLFTHARGGLAQVPVGSFVGDLGCAALAVGLARPWRIWAPGWLSFREHLALLTLGGTVAISSAVRGLLTNLTPGLMGLRTYGIGAIGFVGVATRFGGLASVSLATVGAALFPSLVHLMETEGLARAVRWQDLATRMGLLLIGLGLGLFLLIGDVLVPMVFGQEYRTATPVLAIAFWSVVPLWIGGQHLRLALLLNRTAAYPLSAAALLAGFALCFWLLPPDPAGVNTAWSLLAGNALFALVLVAFLRRHVPGLIGQLRPLLLPLLLAGFGWPLSRVAGAWQTAAVIAAWTALYAGAAFLSGSIRRHEMAEIVSAVWTPRRQSVEM